MRILSLGTTFLLMLFSFAFFTAIPAQAGGDEVTVCHATGSASNPYVITTVALEAFISPGNSEHGHGSHEGDIYPAFQYTQKSGTIVDVPSRNWDIEILPGITGKKFYEELKCVPPVETPEPEVPVVAPLPPTYTPGNCLNPTGTVNLPTQPEGVAIAENSPRLLENGWNVVYLPKEGYTFPNGEESITFTFPVQSPTEDCTLPEMGAGDLMVFGGGALFLLGLGGAAMYTARRQET